MAGVFLLYRVCFISCFVEEATVAEWKRMLIVGLRFDASVISLLLLPLWFVLFVGLIPSVRRPACLIAWGYTGMALGVCLLCALANLFYYQSLHTVIDNSIWEWLEHNPHTVIGMLWQDDLLRMGLVGVICLLALLTVSVVRTFRKPWVRPEAGKLSTIVFILSLPLCVWGVAGSITFLGKRFLPLQIADACFSPRTELNDAAQNPLYTLLRTTYDANHLKKLPVYDYEKLTVPCFVEADSMAVSPFKNVVVIVMEGMQHSYTCDTLLAPFLHNLKKESIYFSRAYSASRHTAHAVFSIVTGLPAPCEHPFFNKVPQSYPGSLPLLLKDNGYSTLFMMSHNKRFDNMYGFLMLNGFDYISSLEDYPSEKKVNVFGVNDETLLEHALELMDRQFEPFLTTVLTISNHVPYVVPEDFPDDGLPLSHQVVKYADYSLNRFFEQVREKEWFSRTLFVLVGDHAREKNVLSGYSKVESHHVALYFYAPGIIFPKNEQQLAGHIDLVSTIMGYLNLPYERRSPGIDLNKESRDFLPMTSDRGIEYIDTTYYMAIYAHREKEVFIRQDKSPREKLRKEDHDIRRRMRSKVDSLILHP